MGSERIVPAMVQVDASAHCQLRCPSCPTATSATRPTLGAGHLSPARFEALLDGHPSLTNVELSNYGEMFLNPELPAILDAASRRGVVLQADNGVNLNHASEDALEAIVRTQLRSMTCSIDGASQATYERYRVRGDFERVLANVRTIVRLRRAHRSSFPELSWQFIVFGHNEHEIDAARAMAVDLGMGFHTKLSWDDSFSPIRDHDLVRHKTQSRYTTRAAHETGEGVTYMRGLCRQLWTAPVLNWDGKNLGCCRNFWGDFGGNAFTDGLLETVNHERMNHAREMLLGRAEPRADVPCSTCDLYASMRRSGRWLTPSEVRAPDPTTTVGVHVSASDPSAREVALSLLPGRVDARAFAAANRSAWLRLPLRQSALDAYASLHPGPHTLAVQALGGRPDRVLVVEVDVRARPTRQQVDVML